MKKDYFYSLSEAAEYAKIGRQAIYMAIKKKRLNAVKHGQRWGISKEDLDKYRLSKYDRENRRINDQPIFDVDNGIWSVQHTAKFLTAALGRKVELQEVYYKIYSGKIKCTRVGATYLLNRKDVEEIWNPIPKEDPRQLEMI
jgi:excisionase family DNA binding protein